MTIFSERRDQDLVALQHAAADKRLGTVGTGWLAAFYNDEFAHTLIGKDQSVCVTATLADEPRGSGLLADEGAADGGHSLVYASRLFSVNAIQQQCGHGAPLLFFHHTAETLRILLAIGHEPLDHAAAEAFDVPTAKRGRQGALRSDCSYGDRRNGHQLGEYE